MTYKSNFVAVIKNSGKILREKEPGLFQLPFGSEYSILLKNLNTKKALVKISIDGQSIGNDLVMEPNSTTEVKRFIENLERGNSFRFIQKTKEIVDHRGDRIDDGIIRVEVTYEKDVYTIPYYTYYNYPIYYSSTAVWPDYKPMTWTANSGDAVNCKTITSGNSGQNPTTTNAFIYNLGLLKNSVQSENFSNTMELKNDEGITVKGSENSQKFHYGSIGQLEENSTVIILRLQGYSGSAQVTKPVTVKTKIVCETCGKHNKSSNKYCSRCGTFLT